MTRGGQNQSTAVMSARAPSVVETDSEIDAIFRQIDFYPTPPWAARVGAELVLRLDPSAREIWEPACGQGHMAGPLAEYFPSVRASDVYPHGFGEELDFLGDADRPETDWIVTNPPFATADQFVRRGLERARKGVALLLRLVFLEGGERHRLLHGAAPLTLCAPFAERVPMTLGKWDPEASTATAYAWFLWMKEAAPLPLHGIPPGTRLRLTRPDDARRYGFRRELPLLTLMEPTGPDDEEDAGVNDCAEAAE